MMIAASLWVRRRDSDSSSSVPGRIVMMSSPWTIGTPACDQQPDIAVIPGITSVG